MHATLVERLQMESDLRSALENEEFVVHYQPLVDLESGQIRGSEALVRWARPGWGLIAPDRFIPLAESTGLIDLLGLWVLRESCEQTMRWQTSCPELRNLKVSVNVSAHQLPDPRLFAQVRDILADTGLRPSCLTLEMTESVLLHDSEEIRGNLVALRDMGVRLAIDDFGTGYSSLSYLHRFPVDILKIDRSFIERLSSSGEVALISTIIRLGQTMHLETVAEGIERAEEMLVLRRQGCNTGQGFHFSPPVAPEELTELLTAQNQLPAVLPTQHRALAQRLP
jgi:EAL domain-containing protein (putative c-di-GMP-specific phosphodiesterase class I)